MSNWLILLILVLTQLALAGLVAELYRRLKRRLIGQLVAERDVVSEQIRGVLDYLLDLQQREIDIQRRLSEIQGGLSEIQGGLREIQGGLSEIRTQQGDVIAGIQVLVRAWEQVGLPATERLVRLDRLARIGQIECELSQGVRAGRVEAGTAARLEAELRLLAIECAEPQSG